MGTGPMKAESGFETRRMKGRVAEQLFGVVSPTTLGRFEVGPVLGEGGMARVYAAFDPLLERNVAIKVFKVETSTDQLLDEGRALAQLEHPHVVRLYEAGFDDGLAFMAMERIEGPNLGRWAQANPRPSSERLYGVLLQAADGLAAIHAEGWVHSDVKASNVLVDAHDNAFVADLGLAQLASQSRRTWAGTEAYMAPEQLDGEPATPAADCYSFCLTAAELLVGETAPREAEARVKWGATLSQRGVPPRLHRLLQRGLEPNPEARVGSMVTMARELRTALGPDWRVRGTWWVLSALLCVAAVVGFVVSAANLPPPEASHVDVRLSPSEVP